MTECSNPESGSPEEYYNSLHCKARNSIERTIRILKTRFRCLLVHRVLHYDPEMVSKIVIACCVLHNLCNCAGVPFSKLPNRLQQQESQTQRLLQQGLHNVDSSVVLGAKGQGEDCRQQVINMLWHARSI